MRQDWFSKSWFSKNSVCKSTVCIGLILLIKLCGRGVAEVGFEQKNVKKSMIYNMADMAQV